MDVESKSPPSFVTVSMPPSWLKRLEADPAEFIPVQPLSTMASAAAAMHEDSRRSMIVSC
jgi:hypothetical protein